MTDGWHDLRLVYSRNVNTNFNNNTLKRSVFPTISRMMYDE